VLEVKSVLRDLEAIQALKDNRVNLVHKEIEDFQEPL